MQNLIHNYKNADAILVLTEWEEYSLLDWDLIVSNMRKPSWVFDARSVLDTNKIKMQILIYGELGMEFLKLK